MVLADPIARALMLALAALQVRWERPPAGTLRRGLWWVASPRVLVGAVLALVVLTLALALYRRLRRR